MKKKLSLALAAGAVAALGLLTACAPQQGATTLSDTAGEAATLASFTWSADADCTICHTGESESLQDAACAISASHGSLPCATCHTDSEGLEKAHGKVDPADYTLPTKLKRSEMQRDACLSCHDLDEIAAQTVDLTVLTDDNGTVANPHDLPDNSEHEGLACSKCHTMHGETDPQAEAADACASCHHAGVYECHTCHS